MEQPVERVEIIADGSTGASWVQPGEETERLLQSVDGGSRTSVLAESTAILSDCVAPSSQPDSRVGLVIGYIQSGKTLSFTTVSALANDNDYALIIVLAGTSVILQDQSTRRLRRDLSVDHSPTRRWSVFKSTTLSGPTDRQILMNNLRKAIDSCERGEPIRTVLVTVMKERTHLNRMVSFLRDSGLPIEKLPSLIIDDEADQAGLNSALRRGDQSRIYSLLVSLRAALPHHTYLQYTATPQAPLLISLADVLSPAFVHVLTPGMAYTGGATFFGDRIMDLVVNIPPAELFADDHLPHEPPNSLSEALRLFFLGVANHMIEPDSPAKPRNRSMMIHPSQRRAVHQCFHGWVQCIKERWQGEIAEDEGNPDRQALVQEFQSTYECLRNTVPDVFPFEQLVDRLHDAMRDTVVTELNTRLQTRAIQDPEQFWSNEYHILVGGMQLDRGFTVEGLTVTYMPRSLGVGNADTMQQRARWFGYKEDYLGFCRVFLPHDSVDAFAGYVEHEEQLRASLRDFRGPLREWRRRFFLDPALQPTRSAVVQYGFRRGAYGSGNWFNQKQPHGDAQIADQNMTLVEALLRQLTFRYDPSIRHRIADPVSLSSLYNDTLVGFVMVGTDDLERYLGLLLQIEAFLREHPDEQCRIYQMSGTPNGDWDERQRTERAGSDTINPHQGPSAAYPGDSHIHADDSISIQIHKIRVTTREGDVYPPSPVLSIWLPPRVKKWWVVQDQRQPQ